MMDEEPAETAQFGNPQAQSAAQKHQKEPADATSQQLIDHLFNAIQSIDLSS